MSELNPRILQGYGLIEAPIDAVVKPFGTHKRADQAEMRVRTTTDSVQDAIAFLAVRTHPATHLVLVDMGPWTAVLTNQRSGSDFMDHRHWATKAVGVRTIRVVDAKARWWTREALRERLGYEARMFEMHGPDGALIRSIACADDGGRWVFATSGEPFPIEASFAYGALRKRDRFTSANLADLMALVGPGVLTEDRFLNASRYALLEERWKPDAWQKRILAAACTLEEAVLGTRASAMERFKVGEKVPLVTSPAGTTF